MATENAVAALGKVLEFHGGVIEASAAAQSWDVWINSLPLVEDKVEARHVHAQLVRHIQASDARCATFHHPLVTTRWHGLNRCAYASQERLILPNIQTITRALIGKLKCGVRSIRGDVKLERTHSRLRFCTGAFSQIISRCTCRGLCDGWQGAWREQQEPGQDCGCACEVPGQGQQRQGQLGGP